MSTPKDRMILAALDLLRRSGLAGAGINQVVDASGAPKGSVYHYFPRGKHELVTAALKEAERGVGNWLRSIFGKPAPLTRKVESLFAGAGKYYEAEAFAKGCPVGAVTLDIQEDSEELRGVCGAIFRTWRDIIAAGLEGIPEEQRLGVAELILATLEGGLILSRAQSTKDPLTRAGSWLGEFLALAFPSSAGRRLPKERMGAKAGRSQAGKPRRLKRQTR